MFNTEAAHSQPDAVTKVGKVTVLNNVFGILTLQECVNSAQPITFVFRPTGGGDATTRQVTLGSDGSFRLFGIPAGTYNLAIKGKKWLRRVVPVDISNGSVFGLTASLIPGDANDDNHVDIREIGRAHV